MKNVKIGIHSKATKNSTKFCGWIMKNKYTNFFVLVINNIYYSTDQYNSTHCGVSVDYYNNNITTQNCIKSLKPHIFYISDSLKKR